jgi:hypothetical protein
MQTKGGTKRMPVNLLQSLGLADARDFPGCFVILNMLKCKHI